MSKYQQLIDAMKKYDEKKDQLLGLEVKIAVKKEFNQCKDELSKECFEKKHEAMIKYDQMYQQIVDHEEAIQFGNKLHIYQQMVMDEIASKQSNGFIIKIQPKTFKILKEMNNAVKLIGDKKIDENQLNQLISFNQSIDDYRSCLLKENMRNIADMNLSLYNTMQSCENL